jgi:hypothetical protein
MKLMGKEPLPPRHFEFVSDEVHEAPALASSESEGDPSGLAFPSKCSIPRSSKPGNKSHSGSSCRSTGSAIRAPLSPLNIARGNRRSRSKGNFSPRISGLIRFTWDFVSGLRWDMAKGPPFAPRACPDVNSWCASEKKGFGLCVLEKIPRSVAIRDPCVPHFQYVGILRNGRQKV